MDRRCSLRTVTPAELRSFSVWKLSLAARQYVPPPRGKEVMTNAGESR